MEHPGEAAKASQLGCVYFLAFHFLHGLLHFSELLHHPVHILDFHAGAIGYALSAASVQDFHIGPFGRSHGKNDSLYMLDFFTIQVNVLQLVLELAHSREHTQDGLEGAQLPHLFQLLPLF